MRPSVLLLAALAACSGSKPRLASYAPEEMTCSEDRQCTESQLCARGRCVLIQGEMAECSVARVRFDAARAEIEEEDVPQLVRVARCLKASRGVGLVIEGEEQLKTPEQPLALGPERARAVTDHLRKLGVDPELLGGLTFGELRPLCAAGDAACASRRTAAASGARPGRM